MAELQPPVTEAEKQRHEQTEAKGQFPQVSAYATERAKYDKKGNLIEPVEAAEKQLEHKAIVLPLLDDESEVAQKQAQMRDELADDQSETPEATEATAVTEPTLNETVTDQTVAVPAGAVPAHVAKVPVERLSPQTAFAAPLAVENANRKMTGKQPQIGEGHAPFNNVTNQTPDKLTE